MKIVYFDHFSPFVSKKWKFEDRPVLNQLETFKFTSIYEHDNWGISQTVFSSLTKKSCAHLIPV